MGRGMWRSESFGHIQTFSAKIGMIFGLFKFTLAFGNRHSGNCRECAAAISGVASNSKYLSRISNRDGTWQVVSIIVKSSAYPGLTSMSIPRSRLKRQNQDLHFLNGDGMVACNPRDREAAHRAEVEGIATENPKSVRCKKCHAVMRKMAKGKEK